nr:RNA-directed DNA polymerase, eukaryota [Tanacetum cinerariifolium]
FAGDDNSFVHTVGGKENSESVNKMSDLMGLCRLKKSGMPRIKLMIVVVYAPQEASEKHFNEVRYKTERFGSNFKAHDADIFNSFIHNAGLNEVHLGGSAFTWCHKSATKMKAIFDYGPIPFRFYNYWLEVDGFDKLVRDAWNDAPGNKKNAIRNFMYKLKYTKEKIRGWLSTYRLNSRSALAKLKEDLRMFDEAIDKGNSPVQMVYKRLKTLNKIQQVNNTHMLEVAQKDKIKWVVDGDENAKFFHGMVNKKRNQRSIRGIMVNGTWIDDPVKVKYEFLDYFRNRFDKPPENCARIDICFPNVLSNDQRDDLERMVTKEEVKKAVDSVGNSGGFLCMWGPNSFCKSSFTRSDYFVNIRGLWLKSGIKLMIVVVYAPQEASEKCMLWDYLTNVSDQWDGEIVMIGDFNEVRYKSERFGSNFKAHDADIFNSFIHNAGLNEVHLGGSAFTWCHHKNKDAWNDAWSDAPGNKKNAIRNFIYKLKYTKEKIRGWLSTYRLNSRGALAKLKEDLRMFDEAIDKGNSPVEMVHKRLKTLNKIQQVNNTHMSEVAQKAKIKWVVEGDENTKFFHGMLNKKRNQRSIQGIMVNGTWIDDPVKVKYEFLDHFRNMFDKPLENRARIDICFPNVLLNDQRDDLERMVTKEEVKKAVWDCGSDKSPGPDGFSFSFFRHFWSTIEKDIFETVDCFFTNGDMPNGCISTRWVKSVPSKVDITAWKIKTNALPTRFNLSRRGMDIDTLMCPVCKGGVETTSHSFFQCVLSKQIMRKVSSWWNVDYTDVISYKKWRVWLVSIRIPNKLKSMME